MKIINVHIINLKLFEDETIILKNILILLGIDSWPLAERTSDTINNPYELIILLAYLIRYS